MTINGQIVIEGQTFKSIEEMKLFAKKNKPAWAFIPKAGDVLETIVNLTTGKKTQKLNDVQLDTPYQYINNETVNCDMKTESYIDESGCRIQKSIFSFG